MAEKVIGFKIQIEGLAGTIETATQLKRQIADINAELKKTADVDEIKKLEKKLVDLKAAQSLVNDVTREQVKLRKEEIAGIDKSQGAYRKLSKELNDQRNRYKDLAASQQDSTQEAKDLLVSINKLDKELKGIDATVGQFQRNVGGYTEALSQFFPKLGGTLGQVTGAIGGLSMGITDLGKTTGKLNIGLGAVGIALTAFSAIGEIYSSIQDTIEETKNLNILISNFTKASGDQLSEYTSKAQASALTFKKDVNDIAIAANTASKAFGIDFADAIDFINIGFRQGADAQGEFLDNLREYPVQFAAAGLSLKDYTAIAVNAANQGIYSDQGLNVVKEFGLRITEQTKASKDALTDAFGEEFTTKLLGDLNARTITTGEAFTMVSEKMTDVNVVSSKLQTVVADVFGSAGEDAGNRYITQLGVILKNTDEILKITTPYQQALERQRIENEKLTAAQARFNQSLNVGSSGLKIYVTEAKTAWTNLGATVLGFFDGVGTRFLAYRTAFKEFAKPEGSIITFWKSFTKEVETLNKNGKIINEEENKRLKLLKQQEEQAKKSADAETKRLADIRTQSRAAKEEALAAKKRTQTEGVVFGSAEYKKLGEEILQLEKELEKFNPKESGKKGGEKFVKEFTDGSIAALENERGKLQSAFSNAVVGSGTQKELAVKLNAINNQIKDAVEQQNQILADATRGNLLKNLQQAQQLATLPLTVEPLKSIKSSDLAKKESEDLQKVFKEVTKNADEFRKEQKEKEEQDLEDRAKRIETYLQAASLVTDFFSTIQQARFKKDADILNQEIQKTEENITLLEQKAEKASGSKKKRLLKEIEAEKVLLDARTKQAEELQLKAAKAEKKIAIAQSIIQGALAVNRALAVPPGPPFTIGSAITAGVFAGIQTATIIAQPLAEGGVVTGERINRKQNIPTRSNGDNVLAYVKRGEVVLNQRQQSLLGGSPTFRRIGIKGFAEGGMVPPISAPIQALSGNNDLSNFLQVIEAKTDAINNRIDRLQAYVVSDDIARDLAEGNKLKVKATL
jgi:hypothetical protein